MPHLEGHEVIDWDKKVNTDHGGHVIDLILDIFSSNFF